MGAPGIIYTQNPAEYTQLDAVIIDERVPPAQIKGVLGNRLVVVGEFERGPVDVPTAIGSSSEFAKKFGGPGPNAAGAWYLGYLAMQGPLFPRGTYVLRVSNSTQATATKNFADSGATGVLQVDANSPGVWGNSLTVEIATATDAVSGHFNLIVRRNSVIVETWKNLNLASVAVGGQLIADGKSEYIIATKLAAGLGRPVNIVATALLTGSDGTFADIDYTGSPSDVRGIQVLYGVSYDNIRYVCTADRNTSTVNAALYALAISGATKIALIGGLDADTPADAITDVASYRSDRVGYCYPHGQIVLSEGNGGAGSLEPVSLTPFAAAILATIPPGFNPAGINGERVLAKLRGLTNPNLTALDLTDFREQGIMGVSRTIESQSWRIRSGITTSLTNGLANFSRRNMADYLQTSIARHLVGFANRILNNASKLEVKSAIGDFLDRQIAVGLLPGGSDLNDNRPEDTPALASYEIDIASGNSPQSEATGTFIVMLRVRIFATMDFIVLRTEIGENVEVFEEAA